MPAPQNESGALALSASRAQRKGVEIEGYAI